MTELVMVAVLKTVYLKVLWVRVPFYPIYIIPYKQ